MREKVKITLVDVDELPPHMDDDSATACFHPFFLPGFLRSFGRWSASMRDSSSGASGFGAGTRINSSSINSRRTVRLLTHSFGPDVSRQYYEFLKNKQQLTFE